MTLVLTSLNFPVMLHQAKPSARALLVTPEWCCYSWTRETIEWYEHLDRDKIMMTNSPLQLCQANPVVCRKHFKCLHGVVEVLSDWAVNQLD